MKHVIIMLLLSVNQLNAQDTLINYFNSCNSYTCHEYSCPQCVKSAPVTKTEKSNASFYQKVYKNEKGSWTVNNYYNDNRVQMKGSYSSDILDQKDGHFIYYYNNGQIEKEGDYILNKREGEWKTYFNNGKMNSIRQYANDSIIKIVEAWDIDGNKCEGGDEQPDYQGGYPELIKFLKEHVVYPKKAHKASIEGKVYVSFIIDTDGSVTCTEIIKSTNHLFDDAALEAVKELPKWIPGKQDCRLVRVKYVLPVQFKSN